MHFANFTSFFLSIWKAIFKQFKFFNQKSSRKMKIVAEDVVEKECLGIQITSKGRIQISMGAEISHCLLLAKRKAGLGMHLVTKN